METGNEQIAYLDEIIVNTRFTAEERRDFVAFLERGIREHDARQPFMGIRGYSGCFITCCDGENGPEVTPLSLTDEGFKAFCAPLRDMPKLMHQEGKTVPPYGPIVAKWRLKLNK